MATKKGDILRNMRTKRWVVVRDVFASTSEPEVTFVIMRKVKVSDGVTYGARLVGVMLNETSEIPDKLPLGYIRPDIIPETLKVWRE